MPAGGACQNDDQCAEGTYCEAGKCTLFQPPTVYGPYFYYRSGDRRLTTVMGVYWHRRGVEGYRLLLPFYWEFWSPEEESRVLFPFYYRLEWPREGVATTVIPPFQFRKTPTERNYRLWPLVFWTDYGERGSGLTIFPLFHRAREGTRTATALPLLLSGYNIDRARNKSQALVLGLVYWNTDGTFRSRALLPFFYHASSPGKSFTWVLPFNFHSRRDRDRTVLLLPFAFYSGGPDHATAASLVPPLFYRREGSASRLYALPFFYYDRQGDRSFFLGGPVFYHRRASRVTAGVFPVALHYSDRTAGERMTMVLPLFYSDSWDHHLRARVISPLFLYERDTDAGVKHWGLVVPPFYSRRDQDREVDLLLPVFLRWRNKAEESTTWVFGPFIFNRDPEGGSQIAFPVFWRFKDAKTGAATSIAFPLFYRHRRPDGSHFNLLLPFYYRRQMEDESGSWGVLPLLHVGRGPGRFHAVLFPALWHVKTPKSTTTVVGPVFYQSRPGGAWHGGLAPFFFAGSEEGDSYHVLFPALWHLRSRREGYHTVVAGPAFWTKSGKGHAAGLLPLFAVGRWRGTSFQAVLPPLFYRSATAATGESTTLAGLYYGWTRRGERGHALFPLFYTRRTEDSLRVAALPLFYYRREREARLLVTPVGGFRKDTRTETFEGLFGPYAFHSSPTARGFAILPLFMRWTRPRDEAQTTILLPFGVSHTSPRLSAFVWFPVVWRFAEPGQRSLVIFPIFGRLRQQGGIRADVVFPLFFSIRSDRRRTHVLGPAFYDQTPDRLHAGLVPLGFYRRDGKGSTLLALPFLWYHRRASDNERTWVFGPGYFRRYQAGYGMGLVPIFFHKRTPESRYTILAPLFWDVESPPEQSRTVLFGPALYRRKADRRAVGLLPLFYTSWQRREGYTVALAPVFYRRKALDRSALYTPLFGFDRTPERSQWYTGLFFHRQSPTSRLDILLPAFLRYRDDLKGETTLLTPPLYYARWSTERSFHLAFPLVWRRRTVDTATTVVFPLFWDHNDRFASRTTVVAPLFLRHRDYTAKSSSLVLFPCATWFRMRRTAWDAIGLPLFWHFGGKKRSTTVGFPLYWDLKRGENRTTLALPFYVRLDRPAERKQFFIPNTYFLQDKKNGTYQFFFFPLLRVERDRPKDLYVEFLLRALAYRRVGRNRSLTVLGITFRLEPTAAKTSGALGGSLQAWRSDPLWH
jgi:hypothetical protein